MSRDDTVHGPPGRHTPPRHTAEKSRFGEVLSLAQGPRVLSPASAPLGSSNSVSFLKGKNKVRRVKTIYDCQADNDDELTFFEGEVIIVTGEEDQEWWVRTRALLPAALTLGSSFAVLRARKSLWSFETGSRESAHDVFVYPCSPRPVSRGHFLSF